MKEQKRDFIVDDIILKYLYNITSERGKVSFDKLDNDLSHYFEEANLDYMSYRPIVLNAVACLLSNRFDTKGGYIISVNDSEILSEKNRNGLIELKEELVSSLANKNNSGISKGRK